MRMRSDALLPMLAVTMHLLVGAQYVSRTGLCDPCPRDLNQTCMCPLDQLLLDGLCCDCSSSSTAMLQPALEVQGQGNSISVVISVWNVSNHPAVKCGGSDALCEPFSVFYTLDGSTPQASSFIACADGGWQGDRCMSTWQDVTLRMWASVTLRVIVIKQVSCYDLLLLLLSPSYSPSSASSVLS